MIKPIVSFAIIHSHAMEQMKKYNVVVTVRRKESEDEEAPNEVENLSPLNTRRENLWVEAEEPQDAAQKIIEENPQWFDGSQHWLLDKDEDSKDFIFDILVRPGGIFKDNERPFYKAILLL